MTLSMYLLRKGVILGCLGVSKVTFLFYHLDFIP